MLHIIIKCRAYLKYREKWEKSAIFQIVFFLDLNTIMGKRNNIRARKHNKVIKFIKKHKKICILSHIGKYMIVDRSITWIFSNTLGVGLLLLPQLFLVAQFNNYSCFGKGNI